MTVWFSLDSHPNGFVRGAGDGDGHPVAGVRGGFIVDAAGHAVGHLDYGRSRPPVFVFEPGNVLSVRADNDPSGQTDGLLILLGVEDDPDNPPTSLGHLDDDATPDWDLPPGTVITGRDEDGNIVRAVRSPVVSGFAWNFSE